MLKLSIIVPIYNVAPYLRKCVDSLLSQDLPQDEYEIILVDDGSPDACPAICDEYAVKSTGDKDGQWPWIHVIHQSNQGVAAARNNGVAVAQGQFVAFLDADDWWTADHASKMLALAVQYPDAGLYACRYWYVKNGRNENRICNVEWLNYIDKDGIRCGHINYFRSYYQGGAMPIWTGCVMMPKDIFQKMGGFPVGIRLGEDFLLWAKTAHHYPVVYRDECLAYYYNDAPASIRATKRLHAPEYHMCFHFDQFVDYELSNPDWKCLADQLRTSGLLTYWMDSRYHDAAAAELTKVDWSSQPASVRRRYQMPIWILRAKRRFMRFGSQCKQLLIALMH